MKGKIMRPSPLHYYPISPLFLLLFLAALAVVIVLIELKVITYAYERIGVGRQYVLAVLLLSLLGSANNIPIAEMPARDIVVERHVDYFGVRYMIPEIEHHGRTILAVNVGGALIPVGLSIYLLIYHQFFFRAVIGVAIVAVVTHLLARPVSGIGIAMPMLLPPVLAAVVALLLDHQHAAPLAYIAGSVGTLLGADVFNLHRIQELGAPVASIGGAGTSDGIFLTGILAEEQSV
jgi:uncharacterized membrane protein